MGIATVILPVLRFNLLEVISMIWVSVIIMKDSCKTLFADSAKLLNMPPAPPDICG